MLYFLILAFVLVLTTLYIWNMRRRLKNKVTIKFVFTGEGWTPESMEAEIQGVKMN